MKCRKVDRTESFDSFNETSDTSIIEQVDRDSHFFLPMQKTGTESAKIFIEDSIFESMYEISEDSNVHSYKKENGDHMNENLGYADSTEEGTFSYITFLKIFK